MVAIRQHISGGSSRVFIDGKPAARSGDGVSCGGVLIGGEA
ncbi:PAAR domain-containing protein [Pectobacterium brasiliense]|nr:PAAR domain-containing protein [Pectobacterium brasiliense]